MPPPFMPGVFLRTQELFDAFFPSNDATFPLRLTTLLLTRAAVVILSPFAGLLGVPDFFFILQAFLPLLYLSIWRFYRKSQDKI
jgi:hypothetical protein